MDTIAKVTYYGPTNTKGSRFKVEDLRAWGGTDGPLKTWHAYDHAARNAKVTAVLAAFNLTPSHEVHFVQYGGEDSRSTFYIVTIPE